MTQNEATELGYRLIKDSPVSDNTRGYLEASLPYIVQRFYLAGCELVPVFKPNLTAGDIEKMKEEGVIY